MKRTRKRSYCKILQRLIAKCLSTFREQVLEFCRETSLHCCKYIGDTQRSIIERLVWAIIIVASLCIAFAMLKLTYVYYNEHNVLSVIESTHHGIWNYPFPAVTICDFNRVSRKLAQKLVENMTLPSSMSKELIIDEMSLLDELLYPGKHGSHVRNNLSRLQIVLDMNDLSIPTVMNLVTRDCGSLLESCKWNAREKDCRTTFRTSITRDGICCSFNYITHDRIINEPSIKTLKMTSCGHQSGLTVLVRLDPEDYHASIIDSIGVKVMIHEPYNYPDFNAPSKLIGMNKFSFLTVQPAETYSTDEIRATSERECVFENDMIADNLEKYFTTAKYSFVNCLAECRANTIKTRCGCVPYYYPQNSEIMLSTTATNFSSVLNLTVLHKGLIAETKICNLRDTECLEASRPFYDTSWPGINMSPKVLPFLESDIEKRPCKCRPDCNFYRYMMENSAGNLNEHVYYNGLIYTNYHSAGTAWKNQSIIHIFFGDLVSLQYRRDIRYSWRHLFATFGGLLGVFIGFSFMTMFEILYFFVLRITPGACIIKKDTNTGNKK